jgi:hypothetical protein
VSRVQLPPLTLHFWESAFARGLSVCWAVFWIWFGFASGVAESASLLEVFLQTVPGWIFLAVALFAWRRPHGGGAILVALGIVVFGVYWNMASQQASGGASAIGSMLALPPLVAGALFLLTPDSGHSV